MKSRLNDVVAPTYLFLCLVLGGSTQGIWTNFALQSIGLALIAFVIWSRPMARPHRDRALTLIAASLGLLIVVQLVPLPPAVWQQLPGRAIIANGDRLLSFEPIWRPLSLSPFDTLGVIPVLIPPIAMIASIFHFGHRSSGNFALSIALATMAGMMLGVAQVGGQDGRFYLYPVSNFGVLTGFFANGNHMAALLLCMVPFAAALVEQGETEEQSQQRKWTSWLIAAGLVAVAVAGLALNRSLFGVAMVLPTTFASMLIAFRHRIGRPGRLIAGGASLVLAIGLVGASLALASKTSAGDMSVSVSTRWDMVKGSLAVFADQFPAGTGAGTFRRIYPTIEDPAAVNQVFVNHAHNDYLEWAIEGGLPGMILLAAFLIWWGRRASNMLRDRRSDGFAQAGMMAAVILLIHSAVDFPLRTAALVSLFAAATGLMITSRRLPKERAELRPSRHLRIG